jgi:hypothetical protein
VKPSHCRVPGEHSPEHAPPEQTNVQVSTGVVVKRSMPQAMTSLSTQNTSPPDFPAQSVTMG